MSAQNGKRIALVIGLAVLPAMVMGTILFTSNNVVKRSRATGPSIVLNNTQQPELTAGEGTLIDTKGVTWEYHNASSYPSGHVTLNDDSYVGVSSSSAYGITAINSVVATFTGDELWLLTSVDGETWSEGEVLTSGKESTIANMWRYVRFYNYSSTVNIDSVEICYDCSGISAPEDLDSAHLENVLATSGGLTYDRETTEISPNSIGGEAVKFTKTTTSSTTITMGFGKSYKIGQIKNGKVEFDLKTSNINYAKTVQLMKDDSKIGAEVSSNKHTSYIINNIKDDWYHVEVPITALANTISGYKGKDVPKTNFEEQEVNAIKINQGNCTIDNLRISASPCELGTFNDPAYAITAPSPYWFKVSWVGVLHSCTMSFKGDNIGYQIPTDDPDLANQSPFYIQWTASGTVTVTATIVSGYNHRISTITRTITVS